jgi:hypothetical protein
VPQLNSLASRLAGDLIAGQMNRAALEKDLSRAEAHVAQHPLAPVVQFVLSPDGDGRSHITTTTRMAINGPE